MADATNTGDDADIMSNHIPETGPHSGHLPDKLTNDTKAFQFNSWMGAVDVTSGDWVNLPLFRRAFVNNKGVVSISPTTNLSLMSMEMINGIVNPAFTKSNDATNGSVTYDNSMFDEYVWGSLKSIDVHLKNFLVSVERDTSGGIQWKDEPVFEVMVMPMHDWANRNQQTFQAVMPAYTYTSTLKEGIKTGVGINMGYISRYNLNGILQDASDPKKSYVIYPTLGEFITDNIPIQGAVTKEAYNGFPHLLNPFYIYYIRLINIPRGLSNIKVTIGYSSETKITWHLTGRLIHETDNQTNFPYEGITITTNTQGHHISRRGRSAIDESPVMQKFALLKRMKYHHHDPHSAHDN